MTDGGPPAACPAEVNSWQQRAERILRTEVEPAAGLSLRHARALLELARAR